jgi:GT2 family glycosyltransferase
VNWNRKSHLASCLNSLESKTEYANRDLIVVDNGSNDGSVELLKSDYPWVDLITLDKNYGFSIGNNKGMVYALKKFKPSYILLLNNDTIIVQKDWLKRMVALARSDDKIGVVGCKLVYQDGMTQYVGTRITPAGITWLETSNERKLPEIFDIDSVLGACFLIKKEVIDRIGLLDEGFSPFIHEESDFCMRAKKAGYRTCIILSVSVVHLLGSSISKKQTELVESVVRRNTIRFMLLNFPKSWLIGRVPNELKLFLGCFARRNNNKRLVPSIRIVTREELLRNLRVNICGWLYNFFALPDILIKRKNRGTIINAIEQA